MEPKRAILLIATLALAINVSASRKYVFKHFTTDAGLPDNSITASARDSYGFLWFGSKTGISRFDGKTFIPLEEYDRINNLGGWVFDLREDREGLMWFASHSGVGYYNQHTGLITIVPELDAAVDTHIEQDAQGAIWLTRSDMIYRYYKESGKLVSYPADKYFSCVTSCVDSNGEMWFGGNDGYIRRYDDRLDEFVIIPMSDYISLESGERPFRIQNIADNKVLIGTTFNNIILMDVVTGSKEVLPIEFNTTDMSILQRILERIPGEYWIATRRGLYIYNDKDKTTEVISNTDRWELEDLNVICMITDREDNVWIGTFHAGLSTWYNNDDSIKRYFPDGKPGSINGAQFRALAEDNDGNIWIGSQNGHINVLGSNDKMINEVTDPQLSWLNFYTILPVGDDMWVGTYNNGIFVVDKKSGKVKERKQIPSQRIIKMANAPDGTIYIGTGSGLFTYDRKSDRFKYDEGIGNTMVYAFCFASDGSTWVGTYRDGLYIREAGSDRYEHLNAAESKGEKLRSDYITNIFEDLDHNIWIASEGGCISSIALSDPKRTVTNYGHSEGFPTNTASSIIQDNRGYLWIGTTGGLVQFDPRTKSIVDIFNDPNDTAGNNYTYDSALKSTWGSIYMGTSKGVIVFHPERMKHHSKNIPVYITDICTKNRDESISLFSDGVSPLEAESIKVPLKKAKYLEMNFSAISFMPETPVVYEYSLSRSGKDVFSRTENNTIIFSNLSKGRYVFKLRSSGNTDPSLERTLKIRVVPPFWACNAALLTYLLLFSAVLWYGFRMRLGRIELKRKAEMEELQNARNKELYDAKINFFTNITHEIRTPLSLIKMPVEKIIANKEYKAEASEDIMFIQRNLNRLLEITNQLLNMRKMEVNAPELNFELCDITSTVKETVEQFQGAAKDYHKTMELEIPEMAIESIVDIDAFKKILSNLLSNAIKYSKKAILVKLEKNKDTFRLTVDSDGDPIRGEERELIFRPFFRREEGRKDVGGTGLGLPYARSLAVHMNGSLSMDDRRTDVNSFVLVLPLLNKINVTLPAVEEEIPAASDEESLEILGKKHTILVVEDSADMKKYIERELSAQYKILTASNGEDALAIIQDKKVDMVISDIMMPVMDGCELCNRIKENVEFSHIPVILLTAAVGMEKRMESLRIGADGYIEKPFSIDLLKANISNLFRNREISYHQFTASPLSHFSSTVTNDIDDEFMDKLHNTIMQNMAERELNTEELVELMKISKSTLYRKIKANTGLNTSEYVRLCRLKKAAELLASQEYRINEVAYMVGFSSPSYFATAFLKQFKVSPSAFVKNLNGE